MRLSAQEEYGLRCLLQVARIGSEQPAQIAEVARLEGLSPEYAAKLLRVLRKGGLLTSVRGAGGGYQLARPATDITLWQVIDVLDGALFDDAFCVAHGGQGPICVHSTTACSIRSLWKWMGGALERVLRELTLDDLARGTFAARAPTPLPDPALPAAGVSQEPA